VEAKLTSLGSERLYVKNITNRSTQLMLIFYSLKHQSRMPVCENLHLAFSFTTTSTEKVIWLIPPHSSL